MSASATARPSGSRLARAPGFPVLSAITVGGLVAGASALAFALANDGIGEELGEPLVIASIWSWTIVAYFLGGALAWWRRPASRFGPLMVVTGCVCFLVTLSWTTSDVPYTIGQTLDKLPTALFLHVFLAFPTGRLNGRFEKGVVAVAYAAAILLEPARMVVGDYGPHNLFGIVSAPAAFNVVRNVQLLVLAGCCVAGVAILAARRMREGRPLRRALALLNDAFALGLAMIAVFFLANMVDAPAVAQIRWVTFVALGLAPVAFAVGLVHARLARSSVGDLLVELRRDASVAGLVPALGRALRDPSLTLAFWLPEFETWADLDGRAVDLPDLGSGRAITLVEHDGARLAALVHDHALEEEPELLTAVGAAAAIALENGRLHAEQRAHLEELRGSRARVIQAGQRERQRLERDLHDGAQQRLIALSLELRRLEERLGSDPDARARLDQARGEIATSLAELRDVARGLHPAVVSGHGLAVALEQLAALAPVPVQLHVDLAARLPEQVEVAAYYVVSEGLANVAKHAAATSARVDVTRADGRAVVEVVDDGAGGADTESGSGLRGLADRVEALGGRLRVWSPAGGGTRLRAELPCE
jgi:signal transduction histidine kinase